MFSSHPFYLLILPVYPSSNKGMSKTVEVTLRNVGLNVKEPEYTFYYLCVGFLTAIYYK